MSDPVKIALIAATAILIAVGGWIYFSPFQSCVRSLEGRHQSTHTAELVCSRGRQ